MKKILAMILVPLLSMHFVTIDDYEQDMAEMETQINHYEQNVTELESRIEALEEEHFSPSGEQTYVWEKEDANVTIHYTVYENYIDVRQGVFCLQEECETLEGNRVEMSEEDLIEEWDRAIESWYVFQDNFR